MSIKLSYKIIANREEGKRGRCLLEQEVKHADYAYWEELHRHHYKQEQEDAQGIFGTCTKVGQFKQELYSNRMANSLALIWTH